MTRRISSTAAIVLAVGALSGRALAQYPPSPSPLVVSASSVSPGDSVTVQGQGANPGAVVVITFESAPVVVARIHARPDGTFQATFKIPASAAPGRHMVTAISEGRVLGRVTIQVLGRLPPLPATGGGETTNPLLFAIAGSIMSAGLLVVLRRARRRHRDAGSAVGLGS